MERPRILVVDDDPGILDLLQEALDQAGYEVVTAGTGPEALERLGRQLFGAVLLDIHLPGTSGLDILREIKRGDLSIDVIMITAHPDVSTAVDALKEGATDYLQKPLNLDELRHRVGQVMERRFLRGEVTSLRARLGERLAVSELVGVSPAMAQVKDTIVKVAASDASVLIEGESGTGKELAAAAIHRLSSRRQAPFIPVNCGAIPADLMESEFFGHVRGAFTGAVADTLGLFRSAQRGTILLDEVGELPAALQAKLLRVLQEKEVRPVGSARSHPVDVRVVAATNRRLEQAIEEKRFRQDLYYRLNVVRIVMPPLRERREDIPVLVTHFLRQLNDRLGRGVTAVSPPAMAALTAYAFPGNVRELENLLERAYVLGAVHEITPADLPPLGPGAPAAGAAEALPTLDQAERELIARALRRYGNDRAQAARALGMSPRTFYRRLKEYGVR